MSSGWCEPEWKKEEPPGAESLEDVTTPRDIEICTPTFEEFIRVTLPRTTSRGTAPRLC
jgi:hypothetical protein